MVFGFDLGEFAPLLLLLPGTTRELLIDFSYWDWFIMLFARLKPIYRESFEGLDFDIIMFGTVEGALCI